MMDSAIVALSFFAGVMLAEVLGRSAFGAPKKAAHYIIDMVLFGVLIIVINRAIGYFEYSLLTFSAVYFVMAFCSLIVVKTVLFIMGLMTRDAGEVPLVGRLATRYSTKVGVIKVANAMAKMGFSKKDARSVLIELGIGTKACEIILEDFGESEIKSRRKPK